MIDMQLLVHKKRDEMRAGVLQMGELVTAALRKSVDCLRRQDVALAEEIIAEDRPINQHRRMLEQECLVVLAAHQPAGRDLREVGACLELVSELERIADHAADTARIVRDAPGDGYPPDALAKAAALGEDATQMVADALTAFRAQDAEMARAVAARDDRVDGLEAELIADLLRAMTEDAALATAGTHLLWAVHNYERAADRATNIAERVVFVATGSTPDLD